MGKIAKSLVLLFLSASAVVGQADYSLLLLLSPSAGGGSCSFPSGADAYWDFDEGTPTYVDFFTGNDLAVTDGGTPDSVSGKISNCGDYIPGNFDFVEVADSADISAGSNVDFSLSVWFWSDDVSAFHYMLGKDDVTLEYAIYTDTSSKLTFAIAGNVFTTTGTFTTGAWHHFVVTYDQSNIRLYLNGSLDSTQANTTDITDSTSSLQVGRSEGAASYWDGKIDELGIWSGKALDGTEVSNLYCSGSGLQP